MDPKGKALVGRGLAPAAVRRILTQSRRESRLRTAAVSDCVIDRGQVASPPERQARAGGMAFGRTR